MSFKIGDKVILDMTDERNNPISKEAKDRLSGILTVRDIDTSSGKLYFREVGAGWYTWRFKLANTMPINYKGECRGFIKL